jgi:hypothetical protein
MPLNGIGPYFIQIFFCSQASLLLNSLHLGHYFFVMKIDVYESAGRLWARLICV